MKLAAKVLDSIQYGSPSLSIRRTFRLVVDIPASKRRQPLTRAGKGHYRNPVYLALEWQALLRNGECGSQAELARRLGISRTRATQVLRLLDLETEVISTIAGFGDPLPSPVVTERSLRRVLSLRSTQREEEISRMLSRRWANLTVQSEK